MGAHVQSSEELRRIDKAWRSWLSSSSSLSIGRLKGIS
jgi:hypothetical protein